MARPSWNQYFMDMAHLVAQRATCDRKHVGAVIVFNRRVLVTGFNGSLPGLDHCDDVGHDLDNSHCVRTVHAEVNAIAQAARSGIQLEGSTLFVNTYPCWPCFKLIVSAGIKEVCYDADYRMDKRVDAAAMLSHVRILKFGADAAD